MVNELRVRNPLVPLSILRIKGVAVADATQMVAVGGFFPMFFFLTLYMQTVLHYSPIQAGAAYLPLTGAFIAFAGVSPQILDRFGTKPMIVIGAVVGAAGLYWLSRIPADGSYVSDILPGLVVGAVGLGGVFIGATTAGNAGVGEDKAGLAAGLSEHRAAARRRARAGDPLGDRDRAYARAGPRRLTVSRTPPPAGTSGRCWSARSSCSPRASSQCWRPNTRETEPEAVPDAA